MGAFTPANRVIDCDSPTTLDVNFTLEAATVDHHFIASGKMLSGVLCARIDLAKSAARREAVMDWKQAGIVHTLKSFGVTTTRFTLELTKPLDFVPEDDSDIWVSTFNQADEMMADMRLSARAAQFGISLDAMRLIEQHVYAGDVTLRHIIEAIRNS